MEYKDGKWKRKRLTILKRDKYMCQESQRFGKAVTATMVHHIYPIEVYPELRLVDWNLLSLSDSKHNKMHIRDTHELTALGKEWQERRRKQFNQWIEQKEKG